MALLRSWWKWLGPTFNWIINTPPHYTDEYILGVIIELTISVIPAIPNAFTCPGLKCAKCTPTPRSWYAFVSSYRICVALYGTDQRSVDRLERYLTDPNSERQEEKETENYLRCVNLLDITHVQNECFGRFPPWFVTWMALIHSI